MKKSILILAGALTLISCGGLSKEETKGAITATEDSYVKIQINDVQMARFNLYIIDSCEYIGDVGHYGQFLAHKGNCKYCKTRNK